MERTVDEIPRDIVDDILTDEAIGILAWLTLWLPAWLYVAWKIALASSVGAGLVERRDDSACLPAWQVPIPLLCAVAAVFAIYLSQYLSWTTVGNRHIDGPQGRYWLPLLPVVAFALPRLPPLPIVGAVLTAVAVVVGVADVFTVPGVVIRFFYLQ